MQALSEAYVAAATAAQQALYLAAGEEMLAIYHGTAFNAHYLLGTIALLILSFVMLRSEQFSKGTAYTGIVSNGWTSSTFL